MNGSSVPTTSGAEARNPCLPDDSNGLFDRFPGDTSEEADDLLLPGEPSRADVAALSSPCAARASAAPTEEQLAGWIARIVERDGRALETLYDATWACVRGLVLRVVRRPALADEVVEETYFQVWRQAVRFDPARGRALAWLLGMARSRAIDAVRREARFQGEPLDEASGTGLVGDAPASDELLDAARGHAELQQAMLRLHAQPRQLVALAFFRGLSHEEIASETALPLGTVKSQIRRALITLRQLLGDGARHALAP